MGRLRLDLPAEFLFSTDLTVRITDINYGGHLGNDALLALLQEARMQFLARYGFSEQDVGGAGMIMTDSLVVYMAEAFHGDRLTIGIALGELQTAGCDLFYRVVQKDSGKEVARAKTGMAFFDYGKRRVVAAPEKFRTVFAPGGTAGSGKEGSRDVA